MSYLLDTCALSELSSSRPNPAVVAVLTALPREHLYVSAITIGELNHGIERLPLGARKTFLQKWFEESVIAVFSHRIIDIDTPTALYWGKLRAAADAEGEPMQTIDGLLAATALVHGLTIITRNEKDFSHAGLRVLNPWR